MDIAKLTKSIKACAHHPNHDCESCEYSDENLWCYNDELISDFEILMKSHEPTIVTDIQLSRDGFIFGGCPNCKALITMADHKKFCGYCGQAVKWHE